MSELIAMTSEQLRDFGNNLISQFNRRVEGRQIITRSELTQACKMGALTLKMWQIAKKIKAKKTGQFDYYAMTDAVLAIDAYGTDNHKAELRSWLSSQEDCGEYEEYIGK